MFPSSVQPGEVSRLLVVQGILLVAVSGAFFAVASSSAGLSALFGGGVEIVRSLLLARTVSKAMRAARASPGSETTALYIGAVQRFAAVLVLFGLGMGSLGLEPVPMLIAFAVAQGAFLLARIVRETRRRADSVRTDRA